MGLFYIWFTIFISELNEQFMNTREQLLPTYRVQLPHIPLEKRGELEDQASMYDFLAKTIPNDLESEAKIELIDEIFQYVSTRLSRE